MKLEEEIFSKIANLEKEFKSKLEHQSTRSDQNELKIELLERQLEELRNLIIDKTGTTDVKSSLDIDVQGITPTPDI